MAYGVCMCMCVCVKAFESVQKCVLAYWQMREGKRDREREGEAKDDLGVMRASKIMVPSGIMGLNLIC